jgi:hypothetical protein
VELASEILAVKLIAPLTRTLAIDVSDASLEAQENNRVHVISTLGPEVEDVSERLPVNGMIFPAITVEVKETSVREV